MALDLSLFSKKIISYREQFQLSISELSDATGINKNTLTLYEADQKTPTGDEILILADFFKCDYKYLISNEKIASFDQTDTLFRRHGNEFSKDDRWAVQEFLFLCECEAFLLAKLGKTASKSFSFTKVSSNHKKNGIAAAKKLREYFNYKNNKVVLDIYADFREIGIHTFRRKLSNSKISGLYIKHPFAGKCILINYSEDVYRQRFTAAHEAAHAILEDDQEDVLVSFTGQTDYVEVGANNFASQYLLPPEALKLIPGPTHWPTEKVIDWANKFKVSTEAFAYALRNAGLIDPSTVNFIKNIKVKNSLKSDPELPSSLSMKTHERKEELLKQGLSDYYVKLCFEAYRNDIISAARMAEMLLIDQNQLYELSNLYNEPM